MTAAVRCFDGRGYAGSSMEELASTAETSPANLYEYFRDKQAILDAVIERAVSQVVERTRDVVERTPDPRERLEALVRTLVGTVVADVPLAAVARHDRLLAGERTRSVARRGDRFVVDEWVRALRSVRPGCPEREAVVMVRAALGLVFSVTHTEPALRGRRLEDELVGGALAGLMGTDADDLGDASAQQRA